MMLSVAFSVTIYILNTHSKEVLNIIYSLLFAIVIAMSELVTMIVILGEFNIWMEWVSGWKPLPTYFCDK